MSVQAKALPFPEVSGLERQLDAEYAVSMHKLKEIRIAWRPMVTKMTDAVFRHWSEKLSSKSGKIFKATVSSVAYNKYVGRYQLAPTFFVRITHEGDKLIVQGTDQPKVELKPKSETAFDLAIGDARISFVVGGSGDVSKLILHQGGEETLGLRVD